MHRARREGVGRRWRVCGAATLACTLAWANAPAGRYTVTGDSVLDNQTHLTWQRTPAATTYTFASALGACTAPWRLPAVKELRSIVDFRRRSPAIDPVAFPNTPSDYFWTATPLASGSLYAWRVSFTNGSIDYFNRPYSFRVRCVQ